MFDHFDLFEYRVETPSHKLDSLVLMDLASFLSFLVLVLCQTVYQYILIIVRLSRRVPISSFRLLLQRDFKQRVHRATRLAMSQDLCQLDTCIPQSDAHDKAVVVGIYGLPGSGKPYFLNQLEKEPGKNISLTMKAPKLSI